MSEAELIFNKYGKFSSNIKEFCKLFFTIRDQKTGIITPIGELGGFSKLQNKTFDSLLSQYESKKYIHAVIVKGRRAQQSTLIGMLACWCAIFRPNSNILLVANSEDNVLGVLKEAYASIIDNENVRSLLSLLYGGSSEQAIVINRESIKLVNGSTIMTATAGTNGQAIGAGGSYQFIHITEMFFNYSQIERTLDTLKGNYFLVMESTPRPSTAIHDAYLNTMKPFSKSILIFHEWWQDEFNTANIENYEPTNRVREYASLYNPHLTTEQLAFMELKLIDKSLEAFNEEYPATPELAFMQKMQDCFFEPSLISKCMRPQGNSLVARGDLRLYPVILGIDPAYTGQDNCCVSVRQGDWVHEIISFKGIDTLNIISQVYSIIDKYRGRGVEVRKIFIDKTGSDGLVALLREQLGSKVQGISFGEESTNKIKYANKGAEMMDKVKQAMVEGLSIPFDKNLSVQLANIKLFFDEGGKLIREKKDKLREKIGMSPDELDSLALTYAYPVFIDSINKIKINNLNYKYSQSKNEDMLNSFRRWD